MHIIVNVKISVPALQVPQHAVERAEGVLWHQCPENRQHVRRSCHDTTGEPGEKDFRHFPVYS